MSTLANNFKDSFLSKKQEEYSIEEYLELCKTNKDYYANAAERMLKAIGEPILVDTANDSRLSRIFSNRKIKVYPAFKDFYGMEDVIENIVNHFKHAAQNLEESKQILYLLGPVGGGKSSLAEKLKKLMEKEPIYVLKANNQLSPIFESPLGLFFEDKYADILEEKYNIPKRYLKVTASPWAIKRLNEFDGDLSKFSVVKIYPSILNQIAVSKAEPGDDNNSDIAVLVGSVNINKLQKYGEDDPDAYGFTGSLNIATQGIMEFVEMFKAPLKMLNPLLTATQERNYNGTRRFGAIPFQGVILSHCFSDDTELLTKQGWLTHDKIDSNTELATLNTDTNIIEFQKPLNEYKQHYSGKMIHFSSNSMDHLVTPNHKMVYHTQFNDTWNRVTADEYGETGKIVAVSGITNIPDYDISDEMLRLIVWTVTDGTLQGNKIRWHLGKDRKIERLTRLLDDMHIDYQLIDTSYVTVGGLHTKNIVIENSFNLDKSLPEYFHELSSRQAQIVLDEYSHTDGTRTATSRSTTIGIGTSYDSKDVITHYQLSSNKIEDIDMLQYLSVLSGNKADLTSHTKGRYTAQNFLSIRLGVTETRTDYARNETTYDGLVFCYETPNHTLIARRNGKVIVTGNSNEQEFDTFKNNKANEAFLDRVNLINVPYCLRVSEEVEIYKKLLNNSELSNAPVAPKTLEMLAQFSILSRLYEPENSELFPKLLSYDGEYIKETYPRAKTYKEYKEQAGVREGMDGLSTRFAYKILSKTFNYDTDEIAANPIHLMYILEKQIMHESFSKEKEERLINFIEAHLKTKYAEFVGEELQKAYLESYKDYGQNLFDNYIKYADFWIQNNDYRDPDTGTMMNRDTLNSELEKIEKAANISNPKDFRNEIVNFALRVKAENGGKSIDWTSYEKLRRVIEKRMFSQTEDILPIISFGTKKSSDDQTKHQDFVNRMLSRGYTNKQVQLIVNWYIHYSKSN